MNPYLDLFGLSGLPDTWVPGVAPTGPGRMPAIAASDVEIVEAARPGFSAQRIKSWSSEFNTRFRKRYGKTVPMGQSAPELVATGTSPPAVSLKGTPVLGSMAFVLSIVAAGALGVAAFTWSSDGGQSSWSSVAAMIGNGGSSYTAPTLSFAAPAPGGVRAEGTLTVSSGVITGVTVTVAGSGYSARYPATPTITDSTGTEATLLSTLVPVVFATAPAVVLPGSGVSAVFPPGTYSLDNVYESETAVPEVVLKWLAACLTIDLYQARGVNPQDPQIALAKEDRDTTFALLKESADSKDGLIDIPLSEDEGTAISSGSPLSYSEQSPYVGFDRQEEVARRQDATEYRR